MSRYKQTPLILPQASRDRALHPAGGADILSSKVVIGTVQARTDGGPVTRIHDNTSRQLSAISHQLSAISFWLLADG
jgi:hypothetical protein